MTPPATMRINGQEAKLFREGPPAVYLLPDGRFAAEWSGKWLVRSSIKSLDSKIKSGRPTLKIMSFDRSISFRSRKVQEVNATEFLDSKIVDQDGKRVYKGYEYWYVYNDLAAKQLKDLDQRIQAAEKSFNEEVEHILKVNHLKKVTVGTFKELLKGETGSDTLDDM